MDRRDAEQTRNRRPLFIDASIAQDQELVAVFDGLRGLSAHGINSRAQSVGPFGDSEQHSQRLAFEVGIRDAADLLQIGIRQNRLLHLDAAAGFRRFVHQIGFGADIGHEGHHELFADRIDRRIRHLREQLLEVLEQQLRTVGQHRKRRIRSHRRDRFLAGHNHRRDHHFELFDRVTERLLPLADCRMVGLRNVQRLGQLVQRNTVLRHPAAIGLAAYDIGFDLLVVDDPALHGVDQEHASGLQPALQANGFGVGRQHARFRSQNYCAVRRDLVATRAEAVAVQRRADHLAVSETDGCRTVPRLHHRGMILIEASAVEVHLRIRHPGLRYQHHHGVGQRAAAQQQKFERVVQASRIALLLVDDRKQLFHILPEQLRV